MEGEASTSFSQEIIRDVNGNALRNMQGFGGEEVEDKVVMDEPEVGGRRDHLVMPRCTLSVKYFFKVG